MKILLYSHFFYPSIGGIETIGDQLAENFVKLGHTCTVVTIIPLEKEAERAKPYKIVRNPSWKLKISLIREHDIVYSNGASVQLFWLAFFLRKPFVWTHQGYQLSCIDGLGWVEGEAAPLSPFKSLLFHARKYNWPVAIKGYLKLLARRLAGRLVSKNVAVTTWVAYRQPFPGQIVLHTPYRINTFGAIAEKSDFEYDFLYVGRLVSEKGVATLLKAFHLLCQEESYEGKLLIIGDGSWKYLLEQLAAELGISEKVTFAGKKKGDELLEFVSKGRIAVIPSEWEEPMGGVSVEMLAAGKPIIVSRNGGLAECVGDAGILFENGNYTELAQKMSDLLVNPDLCNRLKQNAKLQLTKFNETALTQNYINLFETFL